MYYVFNYNYSCQLFFHIIPCWNMMLFLLDIPVSLIIAIIILVNHISCINLNILYRCSL